MLPSCKQVAEQLSENIDQPVTGFRWLKLKLHLLMCAYCRRYGSQIEISSKTINLMGQEKKPSEALKEKMMAHYRDCRCDDKDDNESR
ncbi:hypothetical protein [Aliikangiella coralliicola]|uniref:Zf-HC2 domain-containing protein n=1 Tax=Aliikangiella coralliicola TaxID=2592383 RepID=A0A545UI62_9GAMM|nr:hypothetical protein [Aliikangiella coralliicola]TQV89155.1 hypothetical protein FLL46_03230 [Aliikangiella coralliicola]